MKRKQIFSILLILTLFGCATIKGDWEAAQKLNTINGYRSFVEKYPQSEFKPEAEQKIHELSWEKAKQVNTLTSYETFIKKYPQSEFKPETEQKIHELSWEKAKQVNTLTSYETFIKKYPQSEFKLDAKNRITELLNNDCSSIKIKEAVEILPNFYHSMSDFKYSMSIFKERQEAELEFVMNIIIKCGEVKSSSSVTNIQEKVTLEAVTVQLGEYLVSFYKACPADECDTYFKIFDPKVTSDKDK